MPIRVPEGTIALTVYSYTLRETDAFFFIEPGRQDGGPDFDERRERDDGSVEHGRGERHRAVRVLERRQTRRAEELQPPWGES